MQTIQQQEQDRCTRGLLTGLLSAYFVLTEGNTQGRVRMSRKQRESLGEKGAVRWEARGRGEGGGGGGELQLRHESALIS